MADTLSHLPKIRDNLTLIENDFNDDGSPSCVIYDKVSHQYFQINWQEYQIFSFWEEGKSIQQLVAEVNHHTTLHVREDDVKKFINYLNHYNLIEFPAKIAANILLSKNESAQKKKTSQRLRSLLFMRFKLFNPDKFLTKSLPYISQLFRPWVAVFLLCLLVIDLYLLIQYWHVFFNQFAYFFNWQGFLYFILAIIAVKFIHEFGHAYASKYMGCHVTNMGVAILVFFPVMYTDVTDSWRLKSHKKRMIIDASGMIAELATAIVLTFIWFFLDDGPLRSAIFMLATVSWVMSLFINLNPFIRFDGYYLLADFLKIKNLQSHSFNLAKWWMHRNIWGFNDKVPESIPKQQRTFIILYAFLTWIYRFFLFLAIAIFVYFFLFKALGIALFIIEIGLLIVAPIIKELAYVWQRRGEITMNKGLAIFLGILILLALILFLPWRKQISVPAVLQLQNETKLYLKRAGQVTDIKVKAYDNVQQGQVLARVQSSQLQNEITQASYDLAIIKSRLSVELRQSQQLGFKQASQQELHSAQSKLAGLKKIQDLLTFRAPFSGQVVFVNKNLVVGSYLEKNALAFEIIGKKPAFQASAYIPAADIRRIEWDKPAIFQSYDAHGITLPMQVHSKSLTRTHYLDDLYLSSTAEGAIPAEYDKLEKKIAVKDAYYQVSLVSAGDNPLKLNKVTIGYVSFHIQSQSLATALWKRVMSVLIRESSF